MNITSAPGWLYVNAEDPYGIGMDANIYVDGNWIGTGSGSVYLSGGTHYIDADNPAWDPFFQTYLYCSVPFNVQVDGDTYVNIIYE